MIKASVVSRKGSDLTAHDGADMFVLHPLTAGSGTFGKPGPVSVAGMCVVPWAAVRYVAVVVEDFPSHKNGSRCSVAIVLVQLVGHPGVVAQFGTVIEDLILPFGAWICFAFFVVVVPVLALQHHTCDFQYCHSSFEIGLPGGSCTHTVRYLRPLTLLWPTESRLLLIGRSPRYCPGRLAVPSRAD